MSPQPFNLPKGIVDLMNPAKRADLHRAVEMLDALQRLKLMIRSGGKVSTTAIQISGKSSRLSGSVQTLDPETVVWLDRVNGAAGNAQQRSVLIADGLIRAIKGQSYNTKIIWLLPLLGSNLAAARVPLRDRLNVGISGSTGFTDSDFSESTGLQGDGSSKYLEPQIKPSELGPGNNGGLGWWENNFTGAANSEPIGCYNSTATERFVLDIRTTPLRAFRWGAPGNGAQDGVVPTNGNYYGQRAAATSRSLYFNGVLAASDSTNDAATSAFERNMVVCGSDEGPVGGGIFPYQGRCGCAYMTSGDMTPPEIASFHALLISKLFTPARRPSS